jgi:1-deoxy-D-xylulose-5-phosphate reductoisomerase
MSDIIEACMQKASFVKTPTIHDYVASDKETRALAYEMIN